MDLLSLIYKKRMGQELNDEEIESWVKSLGKPKESPPDYQISALLSFIYCKGLSFPETAALTNAMRFSGLQLEYKKFPTGSHFVDKHSTGGVGDKVTMILAPLVAACAHQRNIFFPTIAGRGLGHTGGTVDKLESIPGFSCKIQLGQVYRLLKKNGLCFLGQSKEFVPADRVLYALRDVTGTVESIPLMTASILSKKLSESLNYLLIDLKIGSGAFLPNTSDAKELARTLIEVAKLSNVHCEVAMTKMDTPLGYYSGNRLEVDECIDVLQGMGPIPTRKLTKAFAKRILGSAGMAETESLRLIDEIIRNGSAWKKFVEAIEAQGGSISKFEKIRKQTSQKIKTYSVRADRTGFLSFEVRQLGLALVELGAGRKTREDKIDPDVGLFHPKETGDPVQKGEEILKIFYRESRKLENCRRLLKSAVKIREVSFPKIPLIHTVLGS